jgi:hypothetical protein
MSDNADMRFRRLQNATYRAVATLQGGSAFVLVLFGAIQRADVAKGQQRFPELQGAFATVLSIQQNGWWLILIAALLAGLFGWVKQQIGPPWLWDTVKFHLDAIRQIAFKVEPTDSMHHHRVTLFKHVRWKTCLRQWPWSGWLIAVERSGHTTRSGVLKFKAPDMADDVEGVAGMTWANLQLVRVSNLPTLAKDSSEEDVQLYAKNTSLSPDAVRDRPPKARSLTGIHVEVRGKPWGVIVLDSRRPDAILENNEETYRLVSRMLGKLLERL